MSQITRRNFLRNTALSAAALSLPARSWGQIAGANDDIRVAVIGFHGRGKDHINGYKKVKGVRLVALCDVDKKVLDGAVKNLADEGTKVEAYTDIRKLLENKNIDAISIATPNHWHALATIWSVQAGKDVYVEKPVSHNVWEGRKMVEAARKYNKIVQTGTQSRSSLEGIKQAVEWVRKGELGKITIARGLCYKPRASIGKTTGPQPVPDSVDYDLWCGPAPKNPPRRNSKSFGPIHYDWHWTWDYGNGDLGNQGIHQMDIARWFLGEMELAPRVMAVGGRLGYEDDGETPNTVIIFQDYAKAPLIFEVRGLPEKKGAKNMDKFPKENGGSVAVIIHCEGGHVLVPNYTGATAFDKEGKEIKTWKGSEDHFANFIKAMRSRKHEDLNADIVEGHISSALCHTGNISFRLGQATSPGEIRERIKSERDGSATFDRMAEHLAANEVDLEKTKVTLGVPLKMDTKAETFQGNKAANALLTRKYRKPFVVPETV
jgi:predicted dehydrogenase